MSYNPLFAEAVQFEALDMLQEMEALLQGYQEEGNYVRPEITEAQIRRMIIAQKYIKEDIEKLKKLRDAVKAEWDVRIKKKMDQIESMNNVIQGFIEQQNKGEKLELDVATVYMGSVSHKVEVVDEEGLKNTLRDRGLYEQFLKLPVFDATAAKNYFLQQLAEKVETMNEAVKQEIAKLDEAFKEATKDLKPKDKKPLKEELDAKKKEIMDQIQAQIQQAKSDFQSTLPFALAYVPETKTLRIRSNI